MNGEPSVVLLCGARVMGFSCLASVSALGSDDVAKASLVDLYRGGSSLLRGPSIGVCMSRTRSSGALCAQGTSAPEPPQLGSRSGPEQPQVAISHGLHENCIRLKRRFGDPAIVPSTRA